MTPEEAHAAVKQYGGQRPAARALGVATSTLRHWLLRADSPPSLEKQAEADINSEEGSGWVSLTGPKMPSPKDVLARHSLDPDVWRVVRVVSNQWEGFIKTGPAGEERAEKVPLYSTRVYVERILNEPMEALLHKLASRVMPRPSPKVKKSRHSPKPEDQLAVFGLYDAHIGAISWAGEVDQNNSTVLAVERCKNAIDDLLTKAAIHPIRQMLIPVGNDFAHYDNERGETTSGNVVVDRDTRYARMVDACHEVLVYLVDRCLEVCDDLRIKYVGGNHDRLTSLHLCYWLKAMYQNDPRVDVDAAAHLRKYHMWGNVLIGLTHQDRMQIKSAYRLMAEEAKEHWANAKTKEIHVGHLHHTKTTALKAVDPDTTSSYGQVIIRQNPSLKPRDYYEYQHGYDAVRCADLWRYSRDGIQGFETTYAE